MLFWPIFHELKMSPNCNFYLIFFLFQISWWKSLSIDISVFLQLENDSKKLFWPSFFPRLKCLRIAILTGIFLRTEKSLSIDILSDFFTTWKCLPIAIFSDGKMSPNCHIFWCENVPQLPLFFFFIFPKKKNNKNKQMTFPE